MGATLTIRRLEEMAWRWYGSDIAAARAERDRFKEKMRRWFGREQADRIAQIAKVAADLEPSGPTPYLCPIADKAFAKLLSLELALVEITSRVEALSSFHYPYTAKAVLPTLGLSWWIDIRPLVQGPDHRGFLPTEHVPRFLEMVTTADQCFPSKKQIEERGGTVDRDNDLDHWHDRFRCQRRRLIEFLERAVRLGEPLWCEL